MWDSELERMLSESLARRGIFTVSQFRVPGSNVVFDFVLPVPPFGVVEVNGALRLLNTALMIDKAIFHYNIIRSQLGIAARMYIAVVGEASSQSQPSLPDGLVLCVANDVDAVADLIAADFQEHAIRLSKQPTSPTLSNILVGDSDELTATLSQLTLNLDCLFLEEGRSVLENELGRLHDEIGHQHFTSAALRVGRSVEFIIYSACKSWDVPVREPILACLKNLNDRFRALKDALLAYSAVEIDERKKKVAKQKFVAKTNEFQKVLNEIMSDIDDNVAVLPDKDSSPINPGALLTDIRNRYAKIDQVRDEIDAIGQPLRDLLNLRNKAAHASLEGSSQEVSRTKLQEMIELLNRVLLSLSKCGTAIECDRRNLRDQRT